MRLKILANPQNPPMGALIVAEIIKASGKASIEIEYPQTWNFPSNIQILADNKVICEDSASVGRYLARTIDSDLYGGVENLSRTQVDSWICFSLGPLHSKKTLAQALEQLNTALSTRTWLACKRLTLADVYVFATLRDQASSIVNGNYNHISRWYNHLASFPFNENLPKAQAPAMPAKSAAGTRKIEGKFIELPGAEHGKIVVRFPPEASGYLHIGHAKAALLNQYYAENFAGQLIMRFDDTNPAKENVDFEKAILEDLELLQIKPDRFTHSSDYFELMLTLCEKLINSGKAYVDDTPAELMKTQREQRLPSSSRDNDCKKNLKLWQEMKDGTEKGQQCCVRAKIDYQSTNGCLRDPTIYRCKPEPHPKTGTKYKVYPTYDFTCPIVDSIEGVTHTLRTTEYHDRDDQFFWFIDALELRKPYIWEYSRLNMTNTVLSKRKLTWFVENNIVDGWDDPRFPTVRGILRRGMTVEGLKQFIIAQGSSRTVVFMEWDKIWAFNKKVIDPIAIRYTALDSAQLVPVFIEGINESAVLTVQNHPKDSSLGTKTVYTNKKVLIEREDAENLKVGQNATFINWGNLMINEIIKKDKNIVGVKAKLNVQNKDFKGTLKLTWLADDQEDKKIEENIKCIATYFSHIMTKPVLGKDDDFKDFVAKDTKKEVMLLGEPELKRVKKGEIIQIQRKGFFRCDVPYSPLSDFSSREQPLILFHIPDGHATPSPATAPVKNVKTSEKKAQTTEDVDSIIKQIEDQGNKVRELKSAKADKSVVDIEVKKLLSLKASFKTITGSDWKPGIVISSTSNSNPTEESLNKQIIDQGDKIRNLKTGKSDKKIIDEEVKILLGLKESYKKLTNTDWKPTNQQKPQASNTESQESMNKKIVEQGDKVRNLKSVKSDKKTIDCEVKILLELKNTYKKLFNSDWKPASSEAPPKVSQDTEESVNKKIVEQGDKVRNLKSAKSDKKTIDSEVKILLELKDTYKKLFNRDWKPASSETPLTMSQNTEELLNQKIIEQGDKVRALKATKPDKQALDVEIKLLLALKNEFKTLTNKEWKPVNSEGSSKAKKPKAPAPTTVKPAEPTKTGTRLGLEAKKSGNLSDWYSQVITKGEMIEYYDVSGCYILRPWSYSIWDMIKDFFDGEIRKMGVQNCYFPIFVSKSVLEREKTHIADFAPEVAWVTKSGDSDLAEPIAIRPTSETVMYPAYAKWVKSHRDLPLKLNQWNNVVRWEFKHPQPFLRTREFLWQEGHSAFLTKSEADEEVLAILELYARVYEEFLAIPVVRGRKTEKEKFAGGDYTTTVEAFVSASGRAIQGATSHHLGQNFSKMFDIQVEGAEEGGEKTFVYQNSWGITTRTIGVMVMVHGDDKGLVLPPKVASVQAVLVPCGITATTTQQQREKLFDECRKLESELNKDGALKIKADYRDNYSPGWKFNHWELKGVPVRVELGFKDLEKNQVTLVRRDTAERLTANRNEIKNIVQDLLDKIQKSMYDKANADLKSHIKQCTEWKYFCQHLDAKNMLLVPFCGEIECEDKIKADSTREDVGDEPGAPSMGAKSLCIPFEQPKDVAIDTLKCIHPDCQEKPKFYTLFGRSY